MESVVWILPLLCGIGAILFVIALWAFIYFQRMTLKVILLAFVAGVARSLEKWPHWWIARHMGELPPYKPEPYSVLIAVRKPVLESLTFPLLWSRLSRISRGFLLSSFGWLLILASIGFTAYLFEAIGLVFVTAALLVFGLIVGLLLNLLPMFLDYWRVSFDVKKTSYVLFTDVLVVHEVYTPPQIWTNLWVVWNDPVESATPTVNVQDIKLGADDRRLGLRGSDELDTQFDKEFHQFLAALDRQPKWLLDMLGMPDKAALKALIPGRSFLEADRLAAFYDAFVFTRLRRAAKKLDTRIDRVREGGLQAALTAGLSDFKNASFTSAEVVRNLSLVERRVAAVLGRRVLVVHHGPQVAYNLAELEECTLFSPEDLEHLGENGGGLDQIVAGVVEEFVTEKSAEAPEGQPETSTETLSDGEESASNTSDIEPAKF